MSKTIQIMNTPCIPDNIDTLQKLVGTKLKGISISYSISSHVTLSIATDTYGLIELSGGLDPDDLNSVKGRIYDQVLPNTSDYRDLFGKTIKEISLSVEHPKYIENGLAYVDGRYHFRILLEDNHRFTCTFVAAHKWCMPSLYIDWS